MQCYTQQYENCGSQSSSARLPWERVRPVILDLSTCIIAASCRRISCLALSKSPLTAEKSPSNLSRIVIMVGSKRNFDNMSHRRKIHSSEDLGLLLTMTHAFVVGKNTGKYCQGYLLVRGSKVTQLL